MKRKSVDKLPVNIALFRTCFYITHTARLLGEQVSDSDAMMNARQEYALLVEDCKSEKDLKELEQYYRRMGWIPKIPHSSKRKKQFQHRKTTDGKWQVPA